MTIYRDLAGSRTQLSTVTSLAIDEINASPPESAFHFYGGGTYLIDRDINPKTGQKFYLYGSELKAVDAVSQTLTGVISSSSQTAFIANSSGFKVGQNVMIAQNVGTDSYRATQKSRRIIDVNNNIITVDLPWDFKGWSSASATMTNIANIDSADGAITLFTSPVIFEFRNKAGLIGVNQAGFFDRISGVTIADGIVNGNAQNIPFLRRWETQSVIDLGCDYLTLRDLDVLNSSGDAIILSGRGIVADGIR